MIHIQNFNAALRQVIRDICFSFHMIAKPISDPTDFGLTEKSRGCAVIAGQRPGWEGRRAPCLDSGSSDFIPGSLACPCFVAETTIYGKISYLLESV